MFETAGISSLEEVESEMPVDCVVPAPNRMAASAGLDAQSHARHRPAALVQISSVSSREVFGSEWSVRGWREAVGLGTEWEAPRT